MYKIHCILETIMSDPIFIKSKTLPFSLNKKFDH